MHRGEIPIGTGGRLRRLERLMRVVREMSPAEPWTQQIQPVGRRFRFRFSYRIASLQIHSASLQSANRSARLTKLAGNLSVQIETGMARLDPSATGQSPQRKQRSSVKPR
jgi:hypothetical protein